MTTGGVSKLGQQPYIHVHVHAPYPSFCTICTCIMPLCFSPTVEICCPAKQTSTRKAYVPYMYLHNEQNPNWFLLKEAIKWRYRGPLHVLNTRLYKQHTFASTCTCSLNRFILTQFTQPTIISNKICLKISRVSSTFDLHDKMCQKFENKTFETFS